VTIEDSFSHIYGSIGRRKPASEHLRSELAIVTAIAKATLRRIRCGAGTSGRRIMPASAI